MKIAYRSGHAISCLCFLLSTIFSIRCDSRKDVIAFGQSVCDVFPYGLSDKKIGEISVQCNLPLTQTHLISREQADSLTTLFADSLLVCPGGSAANTVTGIAMMGGQSCFCGAVAHDQMGARFVEGMNAGNVETGCVVIESEKGTAIVFSLVSENGNRTMFMSPGISRDVSPDLFDYHKVGEYQVLLIEGYMWDDPLNREIIHAACSAARLYNTACAFSLSAAHIMETYRDEILSFLPHVDILFGNYEEMATLFQVTQVSEIIEQVSCSVPIGVVTLGARGAWVISGDTHLFVSSPEVDRVVDTTGAGDMFAAGFLYGYTHGYTIEKSALCARNAAGYIITQFGARPLEPTHFLACVNEVL